MSQGRADLRAHVRVGVDERRGRGPPAGDGGGPDAVLVRGGQPPPADARGVAEVEADGRRRRGPGLGGHPVSSGSDDLDAARAWSWLGRRGRRRTRARSGAGGDVPEPSPRGELGRGVGDGRRDEVDGRHREAHHEHAGRVGDARGAGQVGCRCVEGRLRRQGREAAPDVGDVLRGDQGDRERQGPFRAVLRVGPAELSRFGEQHAGVVRVGPRVADAVRGAAVGEPGR